MDEWTQFLEQQGIPRLHEDLHKASSIRASSAPPQEEEDTATYCTIPKKANTKQCPFCYSQVSGGAVTLSDEVGMESRMDVHLAQGAKHILFQAASKFIDTRTKGTQGHADSVNRTMKRRKTDADDSKHNSALVAAVALAKQARCICWDVLHSKEWRHVVNEWRILYAIAVRAVVFYEAHQHLLCPDHETIMAWLKALDVACMMTVPSQRQCTQQIIQALCRLGKLHEMYTTTSSLIERSSLSQEEATSELFQDETAPNEGKIHRIPRKSLPSLFEFYQNYLKPQVPLVIGDALNDWPALGNSPENQNHAWSNIGYLKRTAGCRTVPVETGDHYMAENWGQKLVRFDRFLDEYILGTNSGDEELAQEHMAYLAQHPLFDQIPELRHDILVPDYCAMIDQHEVNSSQEIQINAWFGPKGTVSCLHNDPPHNILAQVVGWKRVILIEDKYRDHLYPYYGVMSNTSPINPKSPDLSQFQKFRGVPIYETVLGPGDMLYIPPRCWHHIESLTVSFSVSFWWK